MSTKSSNDREFVQASGQKCKFGTYWDRHKVHHDGKLPYLYYDGLYSCRHEFATLKESD